jgi:hypothetical protein
MRQRVRYLGWAVGVANLSHHDCRHCWATEWAGKVDVLRLQEAGGWKVVAALFDRDAMTQVWKS